MKTWILRFIDPRRKPSASRRLAIIQRNADGNVTELDTLEIEGGNLNLPDVVDGQVAKGRYRLILDLLNEKRLDSNDLAQIIGAMKCAEDRGGKLVFANPTARVSEIFRLTHLDDALPVYESIGAAADHFQTSD